MADSDDKVIEPVGTSTTSCEKADTSAVGRASPSLLDLGEAEATGQELVIENGKVLAFRAKGKMSSRCECGD